ncbi:uncharacterized protein TNCV_4428951 [Trichonephila clavipes]|nr:uncharacterized protein TNCV_4428951 [Trichonephila clavipes]
MTSEVALLSPNFHTTPTGGLEASTDLACTNRFTRYTRAFGDGPHHFEPWSPAAVAEWYRYRTVACLVTSSSPVPLKTRRVGQRCTLNLSRAETSSRWCGVVVRRGGESSDVVHVTWP